MLTMLIEAMLMTIAMVIVIMASTCFLQGLRSGKVRTQCDSPEQRRGRWTLDEDEKVKTT